MNGEELITFGQDTLVDVIELASTSLLVSFLGRQLVNWMGSHFGDEGFVKVEGARHKEHLEPKNTSFPMLLHICGMVIEGGVLISAFVSNNKDLADITMAVTSFHMGNL
ncbi:hypothetical protein KC717_06310, partial [Candidatus Dojkabacteria bacterium]|nr:hypothetical protein [Candidatus Dojkabacteria bacterium]